MMGPHAARHVDTVYWPIGRDSLGDNDTGPSPQEQCPATATMPVRARPAARIARSKCELKPPAALPVPPPFSMIPVFANETTRLY